MFKVLYSYQGWQNANYVLNDVKNPVRTLKIAGPLALGITATLYIFANIAYFTYVASDTSEKYGPRKLSIQGIFEDSYFGVWYGCCLAVLWKRVWSASADSTCSICRLKVRPLRTPGSVPNLMNEMRNSALG